MVEVGDDVGVCQPFKISGYQLSGEIRLPTGNPMSNVLVSVHRDGSSEEPIRVRSDKFGKFSVRLPNGKYKVRAEPDDKSVKLIRHESDVTISHRSTDLDPFIIESFSVTGKVRTHAEKGTPISGAKVSVTHDGKTVDVVTSKDGSFVVPDVQNSPVSAKVVFDGYDFDVITLNNVDPGVGFPVISPARYLLTGKVERDSLPLDTEVSLALSSINTS